MKPPPSVSIFIQKDLIPSSSRSSCMPHAHEVYFATRLFQTFFVNGILTWIQTLFVAKWFHDEFYFAFLNSQQRARDNFPIVFLVTIFAIYWVLPKHWSTLHHTGSSRTHPRIMMIISRLLHCLGRPQDMYLNSVIAKQLETTTFLFTPSAVRWKLTTNKKNLRKNGHDIKS